MNTTTLYRSVGEAELELVRRNGWTKFPPRLPEQPIFYPVLNREYAEQIAREWNTRDEKSGHVGYVLQFEVSSELLRRYEVRQVGDREHQELWIPAAELDDFNAAIVGKIHLVAEFRA